MAPASTRADAARGAPPEGTRPCGRCDGKGDHACVTCEGLSRIACAKCGATGRIRSSVGAVPQLPIPGSKGGVRTCEDCEGRGTAPCGACAKGRMDCAMCERGRRPAGCLHCLAAKLVVCEDCCSGGVAADETMGRFLLKAGHLARAAAFFERALVAARALDGPAAAATALAVRSKTASESLAMQREFAKTREDLAETLRSMGVAERRSLATTPPADELTFELLWPRDLLDRHWPKRPEDHPFDPWAAPAWLASHRKQTVKRLEDELAKARATPPPAAK